MFKLSLNKEKLKKLAAAEKGHEISAGYSLMDKMPNPTPTDLADPVFEAIWKIIKSWDVNVPDYYVGYTGATGSHVMLILNAIRSIKP